MAFVSRIWRDSFIPTLSFPRSTKLETLAFSLSLSSFTWFASPSKSRKCFELLYPKLIDSYSV